MDTTKSYLTLISAALLGLGSATAVVAGELDDELIYGDADLSIVSVDSQSSANPGNPGHRSELAAFEPRYDVDAAIYPDEDHDIVHLGSRR